MIEKALHSAKVLVWAAVSSHGIIGPYFIEDEDGRFQTVNTDRYLQQIVRPFHEDLGRIRKPRNRAWFQPLHTHKMKAYR